MFRWPPDGDAYLRVQRVAEGNGGVHLDLHVDPAAGTVDQAARRAAALGATMLHLSEGLVIADSPGGFTFCLVRWHEEGTVPQPVALDTGSPSRLGQLCLDIPPDAARHAASGAQIVSVFPGWTAMADPTGRPYCLTGRDPETGKPPHA